MMRSAVVVKNTSTCHAGLLQDQRRAREDPKKSVMIHVALLTKEASWAGNRENKAQSKGQGNHRHQQRGLGQLEED